MVEGGGMEENGTRWYRRDNRDSIALKGLDVLSDLRNCDRLSE